MHEFISTNQKELKFKNNQALHGDVIIEKIRKLPANFNELKDEPMGTLAYGEVTGHSHKLFRLDDNGLEVGGSFTLKMDNDVKFLLVNEPIVVKHQEHNPMVIPPGKYKIGIQREYDPFLKIARRVAD